MKKVRLDDLIDGILTAHPDQPLDQLTSAVLTAQHFEDIADHLIGHFVDRARHSGASWSEIGESLGVTKQAAQQRFTPKASQEMFSRFTDKARAVLVRSMELTRDSNRSEIEPAHIALALADVPDSLALHALATQGVTVEALRAALAPQVAGPEDAPEPPVLIPYSGAAKKVIELSVREAVRLGHNYVGTEHILLALLIEKSGTPAVFDALNIDAVAIGSFINDALATIANSGDAAK